MGHFGKLSQFTAPTATITITTTQPTIITTIITTTTTQPIITTTQPTIQSIPVHQQPHPTAIL
jgi:hypothetical protein